MTAPHADQLIDGYLARIAAAAADFPTATRNELLDDIRSHIAEARSRERDETDASILNILDRLGEPTTVVAEARERLGLRQQLPQRAGALEIAALLTLIFPWPVGVVLLWLSSMWDRRDKIIGTVFTFGGYPTIFVFMVIFRPIFMFTTSGNGGLIDALGMALHIVLFLAFLLLPVFTVTYLGIRLRSGQRLVSAVPA